MRQVRDKIWRAVLFAWSGALLLMAASACAMSSQSAIKAGAAATETFVSSGDLPSLDTAWQTLADVSPLEGKDAQERDTLRLSGLTAWLTLLAAIDAATDPSFDPDAPVALSVEAPRAADGSVIPGTPSPSQIKDPKQRKDYEAALEANRLDLANSRIQTHLRRVDARATEYAEKFIVSYFAPLHSDQEVFSEVVNGIELAENRRKRVLSLLDLPAR